MKNNKITSAVFISNNWGFIIPLIYLLFCIAYFITNGENIFVEVHDLLDDKIPIYKMLRDGKLWFKNEPMPYLHSEYKLFVHCASFLKVQSLFYIVFPTFVAFVLIELCRIVLSIAGGLILSKECLGKVFSQYKNLVAMLSFMYGILPLQPMEAFGFASIPILLAILVHLYKTENYKFLILAFLYPTLSSFSFFGLFICLYILVFFLLDLAIHKKPKWVIFFALICVSVGYIITEYKLFYQMLFSAEESLRSSSYVLESCTIKKLVKECLSVTINGYYHAGSLQQYIVFPCCAFYFLYNIYGCVLNKDKNVFMLSKFNWFFTFYLFNILLYTLDCTDVFHRFIAFVCPPLKGLSFARGVWFNPFIIYTAFFIFLSNLKEIFKNIKIHNLIFFSLIFLQLCVICIMPSTYNNIRLNLRNRTLSLLGKKDKTNLSYKEFYSEKLFSKIKDEINYNGEWSIAYGMHPGILNYNGISTLDGYHSYYSENYKKKFRKLIAPELTIDEKNREYFDNWGGRAYIFSPDIKYRPERNMKQTSAPIYIDENEFRNLNGKYIFSRVQIENSTELGFSLIKCFKDIDSPYNVFVYILDEK